MTRTFASFTALLLAACFIIGCGGDPRPAGMPRLYPVSIVVIQDGAPLTNATVQLIPEDEANSRWGPMGMTNASGVAAMRTNARYDGAPLGTYKVVVSKTEMEPHPNPDWANLSQDDPEYWRNARIAESLRPVHFVGEQYGSVVDTPLRVEITARERIYEVEVGKR